jgi:Cu/Ag efflux protein CusF
MKMTALTERLIQRLTLLLMISSVALCSACRQTPRGETPAAPTPQTTATANLRETPSPITRMPWEMPSPVIGRPYPGTGIVLIINRKEGWVEIKHEEIKGLMPAMEMEFWVKNRSLLDHVSVGDQVDFTVVETGKGEYITKLKKTSAGP